MRAADGRVVKAGSKLYTVYSGGSLSARQEYTSNAHCWKMRMSTSSGIRSRPRFDAMMSDSGGIS